MVSESCAEFSIYIINCLLLIFLINTPSRKHAVVSRLTQTLFVPLLATYTRLMDPDLQKIEICRLFGIEALDNSIPLLQSGILAERTTHGINDSLFSHSYNQIMYLAGEIRYEIKK